MTFKKAEMAKTLKNGLIMIEMNPLNHNWSHFVILSGLTLHQFQKKLLLKGTFRELPEADIAFLRGQRNYTEVVLTNGEHHLMARTLKSFTDVLSDGFVRIHKSIVVQRALISEVYTSGPNYIVLQDGTKLDAAKARINALDNDE